VPSVPLASQWRARVISYVRNTQTHTRMYFCLFDSCLSSDSAPDVCHRALHVTRSSMIMKTQKCFNIPLIATCTLVSAAIQSFNSSFFRSGRLCIAWLARNYKHVSFEIDCTAQQQHRQGSTTVETPSQIALFQQLKFTKQPHES
jgi:hypothetical protein